MNCSIKVYDKNILASILSYCSLKRPPRPKLSHENVSSLRSVSYPISKKPKIVFYSAKVIEGPDATEGPQGKGSN